MPARLVTGLAVLAILAPANTPDAAQLSEVDLRVADTTLALDATTPVKLKARMSDGRPADLDRAEIAITSTSPGLVTADRRGEGDPCCSVLASPT